MRYPTQVSIEKTLNPKGNDKSAMHLSDLYTYPLMHSSGVHCTKFMLYQPGPYLRGVYGFKPPEILEKIF
jgi:hypothetical protein